MEQRRTDLSPHLPTPPSLMYLGPQLCATAPHLHQFTVMHLGVPTCVPLFARYYQLHLALHDKNMLGWILQGSQTSFHEKMGNATCQKLAVLLLLFLQCLLRALQQFESLDKTCRTYVIDPFDDTLKCQQNFAVLSPMVKLYRENLPWGCLHPLRASRPWQSASSCPYRERCHWTVVTDSHYDTAAKTGLP